MHFKVTVFDYIKFSCQILKEKCTTCFGLFQPANRFRSASTLFKYSSSDERHAEEHDEELLKLYKDAILVARPANEPSDILWKNMRGSRGHFLVRRMALFILGILIIVFVSSPTVIFASIKANDKSHLLEFDWVENLPAG